MGLPYLPAGEEVTFVLVLLESLVSKFATVLKGETDKIVCQLVLVLPTFAEHSPYNKSAKGMRISTMNSDSVVF